VQINLPDSFQAADEERIGAEQFAGCAALDLALTKARVPLLEERDLLAGQRDEYVRTA
jgi:hypothetical protein